jgi:hypothetical protein
MKLFMCPFFETYVFEDVCQKCSGKTDQDFGFRRLLMKTYGMEGKLPLHFVCPGPEEITQSAEKALPFAEGVTVKIADREKIREGRHRVPVKDTPYSQEPKPKQRNPRNKAVRNSVPKEKKEKSEESTEPRQQQIYETCELVIRTRKCCGGKVVINCARGHNIQSEECHVCEYRKD